MLQDEVASKQKMKEDQKKLKDAQARASQKGPMGELAACLLHCGMAGIMLPLSLLGVSGIKKSGKK